MTWLKFSHKTALFGLMFLGAVVAAGGVAFALTNQTAQEKDKNWVASYKHNLRICVQPVNIQGFDATFARQQLSEALQDVRRDARWAQRGYSPSPIVETGCSVEPYLLQPGVAVVDGKVSPGPDGLIIPRVEQPSVYRLFVFVIPEELRASVIKGNLSVRTAPQEALCEGHTCATVTTGIYVTPAELQNRAFLTEWLLKGLHLERPVKLGPPDAHQTPGNPNSPKP